jgi:predicted DNA binding protein
MKTPYDLDRVKLLHEAPNLVALAIKRGWMSYPRSVRLSALGTPIVVTDEEEDYEVIATAQDADVCRKAYDLRERDLSLEDVAKACGVARGSVAYIIAKGHEMYLKQQRIGHSTIDTSVKPANM